MAVLIWDPDSETMKVNTHFMSGKPEGTAFDSTFTQPVDPARAEKVEAALKAIYTDQDIQVLGTPWDYSLSEQPELHQNTPIGHYRVKIGDQPECIAAINIHDGNEAISIGGEVFDRYKAEDVAVAGPIALPDGTYTREHDGYFVHLETFDNAPTFFDQSVKVDVHRAEALGTMVGSIYNAARKLPDGLKTRIEEGSDNLTYRSWGAGLDALDQKGTLTGIFALAAEAGKEALASDHRLSTTFNMIDKMVAVRPDGTLVFKSYDGIPRGSVPILSKNATDDVGFALARILLNPANYDQDEEMPRALKDFVNAYNNTTGLNLTEAEAVEAAKKSLALHTLYGIGYTVLCRADKITEKDFAEFEEGAKDHYQNILTFQATLDN